MRFSLTPAPRAASMRLRMAASSASFAACNGACIMVKFLMQQYGHRISLGAVFGGSVKAE